MRDDLQRCSLERSGQSCVTSGNIKFSNFLLRSTNNRQLKQATVRRCCLGTDQHTCRTASPPSCCASSSDGGLHTCGCRTACTGETAFTFDSTASSAVRAQLKTLNTPVILECRSTDMQVAGWCSNWINRWRYRHIPGPAYSFPLGNFMTIKKKMMFKAYTDWQAQYGDIFKVFFVRLPVVVTSGWTSSKPIVYPRFVVSHLPLLQGSCS